jgi:hypothetical protein
MRLPEAKIKEAILHLAQLVHQDAPEALSSELEALW